MDPDRDASAPPSAPRLLVLVLFIPIVALAIYHGRWGLLWAFSVDNMLDASVRCLELFLVFVLGVGGVYRYICWVFGGRP